MAAGVPNDIVDVSSSVSPTRTVTTFTLPVPRKVKNTTNSYGFEVCLSPGETFHGPRIKYTYTSAGD
jgi:hypothetical protein